MAVSGPCWAAERMEPYSRSQLLQTILNLPCTLAAVLRAPGTPLHRELLVGRPRVGRRLEWEYLVHSPLLTRFIFTMPARVKRYSSEETSTTPARLRLDQSPPGTARRGFRLRKELTGPCTR